MTPTDQMSEAFESTPPSNTASGALNASVPAAVVISVNGFTSWARPKSLIFTERPSVPSLTRMFCGFRSRWMMDGFWLWATLRPSRIWMVSATAFSAGKTGIACLPR